MGKKAKLKKIRKLNQSISEDSAKIEPKDPNQFIKNLEKQGYSLKQSQQAPEIPEKRINPQI
jgi:hypothetical protein